MNLEKAKAFMFTAVGILALVTAFWLGGESVQTAKAQASGGPISISGLIDFQNGTLNGGYTLLLETGEIWQYFNTNPNGDPVFEWVYIATWDNPVSVHDSNWSQLKGSFKE